MNRVIKEVVWPGGHRLQLVQGDLTAEEVDAIVNAANRRLQHGGGVAGAILRKGGRQIQEESDAWVAEHGPVTHAEPAYTGAGRLPCRYVIHTVGPVWGEGEEDEKLSMAVTGALRLAESLGLSSISMPAISTGIFGFPRERAAALILMAIREHGRKNPHSSLKHIRLVLYDQPMVEVFLEAWEAQAGPDQAGEEKGG
jgi:O-acetyl-ADP-ribose deacetylase (regulator of RNase III)